MDYTIPRGIKVRETVAYGLNGKQMLYLGVGLMGAVGTFALPIPMDLKIAGGVMSTGASLFLSLAKRKGQDLDKYIWNSMKYPFREKEWLDEAIQTEKGSIIVRYHARESSVSGGALVDSPQSEVS